MAIIGEDIFPRQALDPSLRTGLILCGMGGPDSPAAVRPFLRNLFKDPLIFPVPRVVAPLLGAAISTLRAPAARTRYRQMSPSCESPQRETTRMQAVSLARHMGAFGLQAEPGIAMRYWHPFVEETVPDLVKKGVQQFLVIPMYPQYSTATSGSTLTAVWQGIRVTMPEARIHMVTGWGLLPGFLHALATPVAEQLITWAEADASPAECALVFVAHSLPHSLINAGDQYLDHTLATVEAVNEIIRKTLQEAGHKRWLAELQGPAGPCLTFQSKVGPVKWLGPEVKTMVAELAAHGCRQLLVQPISFTCEHIETLVELDMELRAEAISLGITEFHRGPALNLDEHWLKAMAAMLVDQAFNTEVDHRA